MTLKLLVRYSNSCVKQKLEELGEVWLKIPMGGGQLMDNHESLRVSENTGDRVQRPSMVEYRGGKRAGRQVGDEEVNSLPLRGLL